jgi:glucosylceramidase
MCFKIPIRVSSAAVDSLESVAFRNSDDGSKVLIVVNLATQNRTFVVQSSERSFSVTLSGGAVVTLRWT